jgi:hypothetical protein
MPVRRALSRVELLEIFAEEGLRCLTESIDVVASPMPQID